ncbi:MAG: ABC transporter substrate-binding protein [Spirochaetaceae bacterium]|jgi:hypothetical protein|nr:ABC transporter substrate-binding protein [Spirochaetaceae bacterium]
MAKLRVYWSNICLLRKSEEAFLADYAGELDITYFGLGTPHKLREWVKSDLDDTGRVNADVIVSTDLDIFQDTRLLRGKDFFRELETEPVFCSGPFIDKPAISTDPCIAVSQILPMCIAAPLSNRDHPASLRELCEPRYKHKVVLGGRDTSAGRSVVMTLWYLYGEAAARAFLDNAVWTTVPAVARVNLARGAYPVGILPSALCGSGVRAIFPSDGTPAIPTFVAVSKTAADKPAALAFLGILFSGPMQRFYADRAFAVPSSGPLSPLFYPDGTPPRFVYPPDEWLDRFDMARFTALMDEGGPVGK